MTTDSNGGEDRQVPATPSVLPPVGEMQHELKCWPPFFSDVLAGTKTFEVRRHDRPFTEGDQLVLREWWEGAYTGRDVTKTITYVLVGGEFGIERGYCVLGIA